ncbi:uncharacterized protein [Haliotis cracherodii]|uniref:uncharacterized protein n=1 Tax=Haliotis cracherodii TaxID=6455 RepID=UPI0039ED4D81
MLRCTILVACLVLASGQRGRNGNNDNGRNGGGNNNQGQNGRDDELCRANPQSDVVLVPGSACRAFVSCENSTSLGQSRCLGGTSYSFDTNRCEFDAPCDDPSARVNVNNPCDDGVGPEQFGESYLVAFPNVCNQFIMCGNGMPQGHYFCGEGLLFDTTSNQCNTTSNVDCTGRDIIVEHQDKTG